MGSRHDDYDDDPRPRRSVKPEVPLPPPIDDHPPDYGDAPGRKSRRPRYADDDIIDTRDADSSKGDRKARDRDDAGLKPPKSYKDDRASSAEGGRPPRKRSPYSDADDEDVEPRPRRKDKAKDYDRDPGRDRERDRDRGKERMPSYSPEPRERRRKDDGYDPRPRRANTGYDGYDDRPRRRRDEDYDRGYKSDRDRGGDRRRPDEYDDRRRDDRPRRRDDDYDRGYKSDRDRRPKPDRYERDDRDRRRYEDDRDRDRDRRRGDRDRDRGGYGDRDRGDRDRDRDRDRGDKKKSGGFDLKNLDMNNMGSYIEKGQKYYKSAKPLIDQLQSMYLGKK